MTTAAYHDRYGLPLSTTSGEAAQHYTDGLDLALAGNAGADACFEQAIAADEGFALPYVALARSRQYQGLTAAARDGVARARQVVTGASRREQGHVNAIGRAIEGDPAGALALIREHLTEFPRDAFPLLQANGPFGLIGFGGGQDRHEENFALLESVAPAYGDDWWFLSAYAFAHNELGHFAEARRLAERSLALRPDSGHGAHTLGHVFYETGDEQGGAAYLRPFLADYPSEALMYGHLTWHLALFELAAGHYQQTLTLYDAMIRPGSPIARGALIALSDASSLMWRCQLYGGRATAERWQELRDYAAAMFPRAGVTFGDVHAALAFAATADGASLDRLAAELHERVAKHRLPAGSVVPALVEGLAAFSRGDYAETIRLIEPVTDQIVRVGGSNAQREVFEDTLLEAYLRAERFEPAETLLRRRLDRRDRPRDAYTLARLLAAAGSPDVGLVRRAKQGWAGADPDAAEAAALAGLEETAAGR